MKEEGQVDGEKCIKPQLCGDKAESDYYLVSEVQVSRQNDMKQPLGQRKGGRGTSHFWESLCPVRMTRKTRSPSEAAEEVVNPYHVIPY